MRAPILAVVLAPLLSPACGAGGDMSTATDSDTGATDSDTGGETDACRGLQCSGILVSPEGLDAGLAEFPGEAVVLDLRDEADHAQGHIAGAIRLDPSTLRAEVDGVPGQVVDPATFAAIMADVGVSPELAVAVYDDGSGLQAARVAWTLRYHHHPGGAHVLDGGYPAWIADGMPESVDPVSPAPAVYDPPEVDPALRAEIPEILNSFEYGSPRLVDARTPAEYDAGHIPGAINVEWPMTQGPDGRYLSPDELLALYDEAGISWGETVVAYCQTGTRASVTWLSLVIAGFEYPRDYDGSWAEWSADPNLPQEP